MKTTDRDVSFMKRALRLAAKARGMTSPNPMVGAVVVKNGRIIAEDYHKRPGELHAEALAILQAKERAKNATLYVTLEPCCHLDKRTPPCTKAIISSGIKKVVVAMRDPNPKVAGKGVEELERQGIEVVHGVLENEARRLNEAYIKFITTRTPFVTLKIAMTLDGRIATPEGQSKWITGEQARKIVHRMRSEADALLSAIGTVRADNPQFTARLGQGIKGDGRDAKHPLRVIIDPHLETPPDYHVCSVPPQTLIVTGEAESETKARKAKALTDRCVEILEYKGERADLNWLMRKLGERSITSVMIEGGSSLNAYALRDGIVDRIVLFIAPKIIGGRDSIPAIGGKEFQRLEEAFQLRDVNVKRVGEDIMIEGYLNAVSRL
ncbi:MAG: bifunctional diaminohydroxyphosphoribosylaminopyrimidine deaminase/5-amino-6-(5-phosphoribosylamino)uracil reductase RibD [Nitrospirota bacterium]